MLKKSNVNPQPPSIKGASPRGKGVPMAPGVNADAGGKRVLYQDASPTKTSSTFRAPRKSGGDGSPMEAGYTCIPMSAGAKGNGKGNGKH